MMIEDVIKKSILPLAFMLFWFWMVSTIMKVSGQTDLFWWIFLSGLPFGIHKMRLVLIPKGMDITATLGMAALSVIIGALIGSIMIPVYVIRAVYVFLRYIIGKFFQSAFTFFHSKSHLSRKVFFCIRHCIFHFYRTF